MRDESPWPLAAIVPGDAALPATLAMLAARGFTHVELPALAQRPAKYLEALADSGLIVACCDLGIGLGADDLASRRLRLEQLRLQVADAARLGATVVFLTPPGFGEMALEYFTEGCQLLARYAMARKLILAVRPMPGTVLSSAVAARDWLEERGLADLRLCLEGFDLNEIAEIGERLAHVRGRGQSLEGGIVRLLERVRYRGVLATAVI